MNDGNVKIIYVLKELSSCDASNITESEHCASVIETNPYLDICSFRLSPGWIIEMISF